MNVLFGRTAYNSKVIVSFYNIIVSFSSGVFEIAEASGVQPGTKIVLHLKDECEDFSYEDKVKGKPDEAAVEAEL